MLCVLCMCVYVCDVHAVMYATRRSGSANSTHRGTGVGTGSRAELHQVERALGSAVASAVWRANSQSDRRTSNAHRRDDHTSRTRDIQHATHTMDIHTKHTSQRAHHTHTRTYTTHTTHIKYICAYTHNTRNNTLGYTHRHLTHRHTHTTNTCA